MGSFPKDHNRVYTNGQRLAFANNSNEFSHLTGMQGIKEHRKKRFHPL